MKMRRIAIALLAMAALCCVPATAAALPGPDRPSPVNRWLDADLEGSDGYSIHISVNPRQQLNLLVTKGGYSAEYLTRDVLADTDRVKAKLLGRGTVSLRFHPRGPVRHPDVRGCGKSRPTVRPSRTTLAPAVSPAAGMDAFVRKEGLRDLQRLQHSGFFETGNRYSHPVTRNDRVHVSNPGVADDREAGGEILGQFGGGGGELREAGFDERNRQIGSL